LKKVIYISSFFIVIFPATAYAYVDPGVGGMLFQVGYLLLTGFLGILFFWSNRIKNIFGKKDKKEDKK